MSSGVEGVILNSESYRNMGGMINHAKGSHANAEARCVFDRGMRVTGLHGVLRVFNYEVSSKPLLLQQNLSRVDTKYSWTILILILE